MNLLQLAREELPYLKQGPRLHLSHIHNPVTQVTATLFYSDSFNGACAGVALEMDDPHLVPILVTDPAAAAESWEVYHRRSLRQNPEEGD